MTAKALAAPLLLALALSACSSAPQHADPQLPEGWFSAAGAHPADAESLAVWWRQFDDSQLTALVSRAMQQNHDVRLAMARVTAARAQLRQSRAGLLPSFDLPGSASRQWNENDQEAEPDSPLADFIPDDDVISFDTWELALQAMDPALTGERCSPWHFRIDADTSMKMRAMTRFMAGQADLQLYAAKEQGRNRVCVSAL